MRHLTPARAAVGFLVLALIFRALTVGELATAWLIALGYAGGFMSGVLVAMAYLQEDQT